MFLQNVKCLCYGTLRYITWAWKTVHFADEPFQAINCTGTEDRTHN